MAKDPLSKPKSKKEEPRDAKYLLEPQLIEYFKNANRLLEEDQWEDPEEKEIFIKNTFKEIEGIEARLMSHNFCSEILEKLIHQTSCFHICAFLERISDQVWPLSRKRFASHVLQALLQASSRFVSAGLASEKETKFKSLEELVLGFAGEFQSNAHEALKDVFASHVLRDLLILLSGKGSLSHSDLARSSSSKEYKKKIKSKDSFCESDFTVPSSFKEALGKLVRAICENVSDFKLLVSDANASPAIQLLLFACDEKEKDLILASILKGNEQEKKDFVLSLAKQPIGSHFLQVVMQCISPASLKKCFNSCFKGSIFVLSKDISANHVIQNLIANCKEKDTFECILDELIPHAGDLVRLNRIHVVVKCTHKAVQLQKCLKKSMKFASAALNVDLDDKSQILNLFKRKLDLSTSLILQDLFHFPPKYSDSLTKPLLELEAKEAFSMADCPISSRILEAFYDGQAVLADKIAFASKCYVGSFAKLSTGKFSSHLVERIWKISPINLKISIAKEMAASKKLLEDSRYGSILMRNFRIEEFTFRQEEWVKNIQSSERKRNLLQDLLEEE